MAEVVCTCNACRRLHAISSLSPPTLLAATVSTAGGDWSRLAPAGSTKRYELQILVGPPPAHPLDLDPCAPPFLSLGLTGSSSLQDQIVFIPLQYGKQYSCTLEDMVSNVTAKRAAGVIFGSDFGGRKAVVPPLGRNVSAPVAFVDWVNAT